jgi:hypothetical protein
MCNYMPTWHGAIFSHGASRVYTSGAACWSDTRCLADTTISLSGTAWHGSHRHA